MNEDELAELGANAVAYMRKMKAEDIMGRFPFVENLEAGEVYWLLFAADGEPLMLASEADEVRNSAFYNNLEAILPN